MPKKSVYKIESRIKVVDSKIKYYYLVLEKNHGDWDVISSHNTKQEAELAILNYHEKWKVW